MTFWISVIDKLPSKYGYYLTYDNSNNFKCKKGACEVLKYDPRRKYFEKFISSANETHAIFPSHWMDLPILPKSDE